MSKNSNSMIKCAQCGEKIKYDYSHYAEIDGGEWGDICTECYCEIVRTCQLCGAADVMPSAVSKFILVKEEFAETAGAPRPAGIYQITARPFMTSCLLGNGWLHFYDVLFVDKLPKSDDAYDISGHICKNCAKPYDKLSKRVYKGIDTSKGRHFTTDPGAQAEIQHIRKTILKNPDMLRDLECDNVERDEHGTLCGDFSRWEELKEAFNLPDGLPTYHEWLFIEHKGVKVYHVYKGDDCGWITLRPEPRFRLPRMDASAFPTYPEDPNPNAYLRDSGPRIRQGIMAAINLGALTQEGVAPKDSPLWGKTAMAA